MWHGYIISELNNNNISVVIVYVTKIEKFNLLVH